MRACLTRLGIFQGIAVVKWSFTRRETAGQ